MGTEAAATQHSHKAQKSRRNRKIAAIAAGALVVGLGATYTLASWNDSEWVWGGADGDPIGTSEFEVEQFTEGAWHQDEDNPGGALDFTAAAAALTPGDTVYAPVSLRTVTNSIGGDVTLQGAVAAAGITVDDPTGALWDAVEVSVHTSSAATAPDCTIADFDSADWTAVAGLGGASLDTGATAVTGAQTLAAATASDPGAPQHYCFALELPTESSNDLQGLTIAPAWEFAAESE